MTDLTVPELPLAPEAALPYVVESMLYILKRIAADPESLLDGQHHQASKKSVAEIQEQASGLLSRIRESSPSPWVGTALAGHGLTGSQLGLKVDVFNRLFREYLDLAALPAQHVEQRRRDLDRLTQAAEEKRFAEELRRMLPWYRRLSVSDAASDALAAGDLIVSSASEVFKELPGGSSALGALQELSGFTQRGLSLFKASA